MTFYKKYNENTSAIAKCVVFYLQEEYMMKADSIFFSSSVPADIREN
jgi:hypothetical protein